MIAPYYADDNVTLYHADALQLIPTLPAVDHVVTDPPYAAYVIANSMGGVRPEFRDLGYAPIDDASRITLGRGFARIALRWVIVFCDAESLTAWRVAVVDGGLRHVRSGVWVSPFSVPQFSGDRPGTGWEAIEIAHTRRKMRWNGGGAPAVWTHSRPPNGSQERRWAGHRTPKPIALMSQLVAEFTDEGDVILDPFAGSGTTGVAAKLANRRAILVEIDATYCDAIARRLEATERGRLFDAIKCKVQSLDFEVDR
jgi:site-specific DNA-methyltransferase (adenine-specific)